MKKVGFFLLVLMFSTAVFAQENILMTIGDKKITKQEFEKTFLKNNKDKKITDKEIDNYLDLFIAFKLKVLEAERLGYDTVSSFKDEYHKYYIQLADPYFVDTALENKMIKEAYDRSKYEVRLQYILINAPDGDTAEAYEKAMEAYNRIMNGEEFTKVALEMSEAPNVKRNKGDAWYNQVFKMPYSIENFAYSGKIGDVSKPIYANHAYFVLKITDTRQAPKKVRASHIYVRLPYNADEKDSIEAMKLIDTIKEALKERPFSQVATKYSQDRRTAKRGGDLGWFTTGRMFHDFEAAVYSLKDTGDYTGPVRTPAGYHFVQLTDRMELGSFDDEKDDLKIKVEKSDRYKIVKQSIFNKLKKEYNFKIEGDLSDFYAIDSTILKGKADLGDFKDNDKVLFSFADKKYTYADFAEYIDNHQKEKPNTGKKEYIDELFNDFVNEKLKEYEYTVLPDKNEDFKYLTQEFYDGLLLFNITNDMVWEKAVKDSAGVLNYYKNNRNKYNQKLNVAIYSYKNKKALKKAIKLIEKADKKDYPDSVIVLIANKKGEILNLEESGIFRKGDNPTVDFVMEQMEKNKIPNDQNWAVDKKNGKIVRIKDNFPFIRGIVTADYQNELEKQWIEELKQRYPVSINEEVLKQVKKELKEKKN